jgi:hypothetical protein
LHGKGRRWRACLWLAAACAPVLVLAQSGAPVPAAVVEAAYLRNFARYVGWPPPAFAAEQTPWRVCVLGRNHFDGALENTFRDRQEQGRSFEVVRAARLEQLPACQIVFIDLPVARERQAALTELRKRPVLTVGNAVEFLDEGGVIRLSSGERVEMSINLDQARAVALSIPSKMLEVAGEVLENGALRRRR